MITVEVGGLEKLKRFKSMKNYLIKLGGRLESDRKSLMLYDIKLYFHGVPQEIFTPCQH